MIEPIFVWNIRGVGTSKDRLKKLIGSFETKNSCPFGAFSKSRSC